MKGPFYLIEPVERDIHWLAERLGVLSGETITPKDGLSLVAGRDGQIVGHLMFARSLLDAPRRLVAVHVVSPSAGMPGCQKRGIGSALVRNERKALAQRAVPLVLLEGDPGYPGAADADRRRRRQGNGAACFADSPGRQTEHEVLPGHVRHGLDREVLQPDLPPRGVQA